MTASIVKFPSIESDFFPLLPEGEYRLKLLEHVTAKMYKAAKLVLTFSVSDFGSYNGQLLKAYYQVTELKSQPGRKGKVLHKRSGNFMIDYCNLFPGERAPRLDRVPMEPLYNATIVGKVRTVTVNNQQRKLPEPIRYSVVGEMLRIEK